MLSRRPGVTEALSHPRARECGTRIPAGPHRRLYTMGESSFLLWLWKKPGTWYHTGQSFFV